MTVDKAEWKYSSFALESLDKSLIQNYENTSLTLLIILGRTFHVTLLNLERPGHCIFSLLKVLKTNIIHPVLNMSWLLYLIVIVL